MARYTAEHKDATRERILTAAAKEFRSHGWAGATIPGIMKTAGLTVGGFYKHFASKAELFAEMFPKTLRKSSDRALALKQSVPEDEWVQAVADNYLSMVHRDNVRGGCVMAALASDMPRAESEAKLAYEQELDEYMNLMAEFFQDDDQSTARQKAWANQALKLGGLILARGVESDDLAAEILEACRRVKNS